MGRKSRGPDHIREHIEKRGYRHNYVLYGAGRTITTCPTGPLCILQKMQVQQWIYTEWLLQTHLQLTDIWMRTVF